MVSTDGLNAAENRTPFIRPTILHETILIAILAHSSQTSVSISWFHCACYMPYQFYLHFIPLLGGPSCFLAIKKRACITSIIAKSIRTSEGSLCSIRPMWNQGHQGNVTSRLANREVAAEIHYSLSESYTHITGRPWPLFEIFSGSLLFPNFGTVKGRLWRHIQWLQQHFSTLNVVDILVHYVRVDDRRFGSQKCRKNICGD